MKDLSLLFSSDNKWRKCMIIEEYSKLMDMLSKSKTPLEAYYEISTQCNFNCVHCYNKGKKYRELHKKDIKRLVEFIKESNVFSVILTGGEFFLHPNAMDVIDALVQVGGLDIVVYTNASLITEDIAIKLRRNNIKLEVSIYGVSPQTYKNVTGNEKNYDRVMRALKVLKAYNVMFRLKAVVMQGNYSELEKIEDFISFYNETQTFAEWSLFGHSEEVEKCRLNDCQCLRLYRRQKIEKSHTISFGECNAGKLQYCIKPDGTVIPCVGWDNMVIGNIFETNFTEMSEKFNLNTLLDYDIKCSKCSLAAFCNVCPMIFYQDTGSCLCESKELCRQAKLKKIVYDEQSLLN